MGLSLSGPPHMKGKLEPLIAVLTQGGSEGRPLRKERQESRDPGSVNGAQHNWPHYRNKHTLQNRHTNLVVSASPCLLFGVDFTDGGSSVWVCACMCSCACNTSPKDCIHFYKFGRDTARHRRRCVWIKCLISFLSWRKKWISDWTPKLHILRDEVTNAGLITRFSRTSERKMQVRSKK